MNSLVAPNEKASLSQFVHMLVGESEQGFIEVRTLPQTSGTPIRSPFGSTFFDVDQDSVRLVSKEVQEQDKMADALTCIAPGIRRSMGSSRDHVSELNVLWADLDFKHFDGGEDEAKKQILDFPFMPHCIVRSGNGFHCYWRLKESWVLDSVEERLCAGSMLRRIAQTIHADLAPAQVAAVLRAPNTWNRKGANPVLARITHWSEGRVDPVEFDDILPAEVGQSMGDVTEPMAELLRSWKGVEAPSVVVDTLRVTAQTLAIIKYGAPAGSDGSSMAMSVITALLRSEYTPEVIRAVFLATPNGIGDGYRRKGWDGDRWLAFSIIKARKWMEQQEPAPAASPGRVEAVESRDKIWEPESIQTALERDVPAPPMLVEGLLREGDLSAIVADSGVAKSWLAEVLGFHFASGTPLWGREVKGPLRVLFIQEEMSDADTIDRLRKIRKTLPLSDGEVSDLVFEHIYQPGLNLASPAPLVELLSKNPYDIVFIDSFSAVRGSVEENDNDGVGRLLQTVKQEICVKFGCHVIFIHHTRKPDAKGNIDPMYAARGASAFKAWVDNMWVLVKNADNDWIKFYVAKSRGFKQPEGFLLMRLGDTDEGGVQITLINKEAKDSKEFLTVTDRVRNFIKQRLETDTSVSLSFVIEMCMAESGSTRESVTTAIHTLSQMDMCSWVIEKQFIVDRAALLMVEHGRNSNGQSS